MRLEHPRHANTRRRAAVVVACTAVALALVACGARTSGGTYVGDQMVQSVADELRAEGRAAYYLGPDAAGLALTDVDRVTENGPDFQVWASYGTCSTAPFEEGGCMDPLSVSTRDWRPDATGLSCQRLEAQLGVPAGLVMGELTLFTGRALVSVLHVDDLADYDGHRGLALVDDLRLIGATRPVGELPPPDPELARWVDTLCGSVPGTTVEHPLEDSSPELDNAHVPDFTVDLLGGGRFSWSEHEGEPVVLAVGSLDEVAAALGRLAPIISASSQASLAGLVAELDQPKGRPRAIGELEREAGRLPAPVGYAADPTPAVWFFDSASNVGQGSGELGSGVIAFVDSSGCGHLSRPRGGSGRRAAGGPQPGWSDGPVRRRELQISRIALTCGGAHWGGGLVPGPSRARR